MRLAGRVGRWTLAAFVCGLSVNAGSPPPSLASPGALVYRVRLFRFVDDSRTIRLPDGRRVPRSLETVVRYPAAGGSYPLIVFGHGFALTPARYAGLLRAWTEAGYVVAAPVFPLGNAAAPGGPNESDLINQPKDMSFVISRLLA
jgi:predicted dienelactone hydrolase